ncbi:hypothetical protein EW145_g4756, partial [Phellinidium pouzarii]
MSSASVVAVVPEGVVEKKRKLEDVAAPPPTSQLLIKRLSDKAKLPTRGSPFAAGYDLYSAEKKVVPAKSKALVDTQISIAVPQGCYGRVAPRSGLASKFMIDTGAGVIDSDYRGIVFVLLFNFSGSDFEIQEGDRIAQLIIEKIETPDVIEVNDLNETLRGAGGFGSTVHFAEPVIFSIFARWPHGSCIMHVYFGGTHILGSSPSKYQASLCRPLPLLAHDANGECLDDDADDSDPLMDEPELALPVELIFYIVELASLNKRSALSLCFVASWVEVEVEVDVDVEIEDAACGSRYERTPEPQSTLPGPLRHVRALWLDIPAERAPRTLDACPQLVQL